MYIGSVTSLYINIKKHLIVNILSCFMIDLIFEALLAIISASFNHIGKKHNKKILKKISRAIDFI